MPAKPHDHAYCHECKLFTKAYAIALPSQLDQEEFWDDWQGYAVASNCLAMEDYVLLTKARRGKFNFCPWCGDKGVDEDTAGFHFCKRGTCPSYSWALEIWRGKE